MSSAAAAKKIIKGRIISFQGNNRHCQGNNRYFLGDNLQFCIINDEIYVTNDEFCIQNDELCQSPALLIERAAGGLTDLLEAAPVA